MDADWLAGYESRIADLQRKSQEPQTRLVEDKVTVSSPDESVTVTLGLTGASAAGGGQRPAPAAPARFPAPRPSRLFRPRSRGVRPCDGAPPTTRTTTSNCGDAPGTHHHGRPIAASADAADLPAQGRYGTLSTIVVVTVL
ncbi:hypothetical protein [Alloactinosynnema sp. L-07]|uniref:hypothetical protein n=1 Tax=Alloactinosynnema sp. L-07 TaxID=1653480 RepID=UPI0006B60184|nr:hypothetical protein [Alloactinosynnema sp. L-07]